MIGIDRTPFSAARIKAGFAGLSLLTLAMARAEAVIHTAAFHAPHAGIVSDTEFETINVEGTRLTAEADRRAGVRRIIFTGTPPV